MKSNLIQKDNNVIRTSIRVTCLLHYLGNYRDSQ